jgi:hypothetical protein
MIPSNRPTRNWSYDDHASSDSSLNKSSQQHQLVSTRFGKRISRRITRGLILSLISLLLAVIGSINMGRGFLANGGSQSGHTSILIPRPTTTSTPGPKATPLPSPSPTAFPSRPTNQPLVLDDFNRKNQSLWGTSTNGMPWQADAETLPCVFAVRGGSGIVTNGTGIFNAIIGPSLSDATVVMSGSMNSFQTSSTRVSSIGAVLRWDDTLHWYKAFIDGNIFGIEKSVNGHVVLLTSVPFVAMPETQYSIRFAARGTTLLARIWTGPTEPMGWTLTMQDSSFTNGAAGIRISLQPGETATTTLFLEMRS